MIYYFVLKIPINFIEINALSDKSYEKSAKNV